jgi:hypothetical protein
MTGSTQGRASPGSNSPARCRAASARRIRKLVSAPAPPRNAYRRARTAGDLRSCTRVRAAHRSRSVRGGTRRQRAAIGWPDVWTVGRRRRAGVKPTEFYSAGATSSTSTCAPAACHSRHQSEARDQQSTRRWLRYGLYRHRMGKAGGRCIGNRAWPAVPERVAVARADRTAANVMSCPKVTGAWTEHLPASTHTHSVTADPLDERKRARQHGRSSGRDGRTRTR